MKKIFLLIISILISMPVITNADMVPISLDSYSHDVSVGSTVTYVVTGIAFEEGKKTNLDGKFIYDTNYLEYVDITCDDPNFIEGETIRPEINIVKKSNGLLEYNVINEFGLEGIYEVEITFRVKSVPKEGQLEVKFYPKDNSVLYELDYANIGIDVLGNAVVENDTDIEEENIVEEKITEDSKKVDSNDECKDFEKVNTLLVIIVIISILGNIFAIVYLVIQARKNKVKSIKN